jgi:hypothetical protein
VIAREPADPFRFVADRSVSTAFVSAARLGGHEAAAAAQLIRL